MRGILLAGSLLVVGVIGFFVVQTTSVSSRGKVSVGKVPQAEACTPAQAQGCLPDLDVLSLAGERITRESLRGKVVMVNFWATWCRPCVYEMPALEAVYERHRDDGFVVLGLLADGRASDAMAAEFAQKRGVTYPIVRSTEALEVLFGDPDRLPTSFIYDQKGFLRAKWAAGISEDQLEAEIGGLL